MIEVRDVSGPPRLDHRGRVGFPHQRRPGDPVTGAQRGTLINRRPACRPTREHIDLVNRFRPARLTARKRGLPHRVAPRNGLDRDLFDDQPPFRCREPETGAMGFGEVAYHRIVVAKHDRQGRVGSGVPQVQGRFVRDGGGIGALSGQSRARVLREQAGHRFQRRDQLANEQLFNRLFPHRRLIGQPHPVSGQNPRVGMDEDGFHAQGIGDETGVLAGGSAETLQREPGDVMPFLHGNLFDRIGHIRHRDPQISLRHILAGLSLSGCLTDLPREIGEFLFDDGRVQWFVAVRTKDRREMGGLDFTHAHVGVGHGQRSAAPVARGSRVGPG